MNLVSEQKRQDPSELSREETKTTLSKNHVLKSLLKNWAVDELGDLDNSSRILVNVALNNLDTLTDPSSIFWLIASGTRDQVMLLDPTSLIILWTNAEFVSCFWTSIWKSCHAVTHNSGIQCDSWDERCPLLSINPDNPISMVEHIHTLTWEQSLIYVKITAILLIWVAHEWISKDLVVSIARDITDRREMEIAQEIAQKYSDNFNALMWFWLHHTNTPLNKMIGPLNSLKSMVKWKVAKKLLKRLESYRLMLADSIINVTRFTEKDSLKLNNANFNLHKLLSDIEDKVVDAALDKWLSIDFKIELDDNVFFWDVNLIELLIQNLVFNSIDYLNDSNKISVTISQIDWKLEICVIDNWQWLTKTELKDYKKLWTKIPADHRGSNVELDVANSIISLMWWELTLKNTDNWLKMDVSFPLQKTNNQETKDFLLNESSEHLVWKSILVVDDERVNQTLAAHVLRKLGINVKIANNWKEALWFIKDWKRFDVILMDKAMPKLDGLETTRLIIEYEISAYGFHTTPIVWFSSNITKPDQDECIKSWMCDFLWKPLNREKLVCILKKAIPIDSFKDYISIPVMTLVPIDYNVLSNVLHKHVSMESFSKEILRDFLWSYLDIFKKIVESLNEKNYETSIKDVLDCFGENFHSDCIAFWYNRLQAIIEFLKWIKNQSTKLSFDVIKEIISEFNLLTAQLQSCIDDWELPIPNIVISKKLEMVRFDLLPDNKFENAVWYLWQSFNKWLIVDYFAWTNSSLEGIENAINPNNIDLSRLVECAHKLKWSSGGVWAHRVEMICKWLEELWKLNDINIFKQFDISLIFNRLKVECDLTRDGLLEFTKQTDEI